MEKLTKKYRVVYRGNLIVNENYLEEQTGVTYPGKDSQSAEFETFNELEQFVEDNKLELGNNLMPE